MTIDPGTLAANLELFVNYYGTDPGVPMSAVDEAAAGAAFIRSMVPLYDVWLKAKLPCTTCDGKGVVPPYTEEGLNGCPDCPESPGVLPFDKWVVTRLLATWEAVHGGVPYDYPMLGRQMLDKLREIGGTQ